MYSYYMLKKSTSKSLKSCSVRCNAGAALVIVLAFVLLLSGLIVAFFTRAMNDRQVSNSSANLTRGDLFAQGAVDCIVGDLRQEIQAGCTGTNVAPMGSGTGIYVYTPKVPSTAIPFRMGTKDSLANLVKRSAYNAAPYSGSDYSIYPAPMRAANIPTSTQALNGRYISPARWNKPLLLPKAKSDSDTDLTPISDFVMPDWIYVTRSANNPTTWSTALMGSGTGAVVGRYAFAVYDEGGLLDMNYAGYPSTTGSNSLLAAKGNLAFADLHLIPGLNGLSSDRQNQVIDAIVGWRNQASTNASGQFPNLNISATNAGNYITRGASGMLGNLRLNSGLLNNGQSDRAFPSRQSLIQLLVNGIAGNAQERASLQVSLNYLGTFTRDVNQPSFTPDPLRPKVLSPGTGGGSLAVGNDDSINPSILAAASVRVQSSFARNDGSTAKVGEPLVSTRFSLRRLAWLTYQGPSANRNLDTDEDMQLLINIYGISKAFLLEGTAENIKKYFGLEWKTPLSPYGRTPQWCYDVHNGGGKGSSGKILRLAEVAALSGQDAREPDFFELLKAGITVGSLGKSRVKGPNLFTTPGGQGNTPLENALVAPNIDYVRDSSIDGQIIQIGANIIDQFDVDGFSTGIYFDDGGGGGDPSAPVNVKLYSGVEDQPYLYRIRNCAATLRFPLASGTSFPSSFPSSPVRDQVWDANNSPAIPPAQLTDSGVGVLVAVPDVWNPHDANHPLPSATLRPTKFRAVPYVETSTDMLERGMYGTITVQSFISKNYGNGGYVGSTTHYSSQDVKTVPASLVPDFAPVSPTAGSVAKFQFTQSPTGVLSYTPKKQRATESDCGIIFEVPASTSGSSYYREPTTLARPSSDGRNIRMFINSSSSPDALIFGDYLKLNPGWLGSKQCFQSPVAVFANPSPEQSGPSPDQFIGIPLGLFPLAWPRRYSLPTSPATTGTSISTIGAWYVRDGAFSDNNGFGTYPEVHSAYLLQYESPSSPGTWITYDKKWVDFGPRADVDASSPYLSTCPLPLVAGGTQSSFLSLYSQAMSWADPRTSRFGTRPGANTYPENICAPGAEYDARFSSISNSFRGIIDPLLGTNVTEMPDASLGFAFWLYHSWNTPFADSVDPGFHYNYWNYRFNFGPLSRNTATIRQNGAKFANDPTPVFNNPGEPVFYTDCDGVLRRAMGGYNGGTSTIGLPMARAVNYPSYNSPSAAVDVSQQFKSRPVVLNRPFQSVGELGYVFTGTPWKNIDFFTVESPHTCLADLFCLHDPDDSSGVVGGRVNLNSRNPEVLAAVIAGGYKDINDSGNAILSGSQALMVGRKLTTRTKSTPLTNVAELIGRWVSKSQIAGTFDPALYTNCDIDGAKSYDGFCNDIGTALANSESSATQSEILQNVQRFRESAIRPLLAVGTARTWNLMIDVIAQTGRHPQSAKGLADFVVEGERRYWVHIAIDRITGAVVDKQIEFVNE